MKLPATFSGAAANLERQFKLLGRAWWTSILSMLPVRLRRDPESAGFFLCFTCGAVASAAVMGTAWGSPIAQLIGLIGLGMALYWMRDVWRDAGP